MKGKIHSVNFYSLQETDKIGIEVIVAIDAIAKKQKATIHAPFDVVNSGWFVTGRQVSNIEDAGTIIVVHDVPIPFLNAYKLEVV